ncbi:hypothetical protein GCM10010985_33950 [Caballeronia grimmiae]|uniref:Uncharacterized protein n=1 Tax=Caballeronia grimmiae TaxID=1071679 RepID=A0ABQ1RSE0_9BURK|nr:hypothetical protein GCM10010985_33950 [Caballeronia grimmiae]
MQAALQQEFDAQAQRMRLFAQRAAQCAAKRHREAGLTGRAFHARRLPCELAIRELPDPECEIALPLLRFHRYAFGFENTFLIQREIVRECFARISAR